MNYSNLFITQAGVYAVFWVLVSLHSLRNIRKSYEERYTDADKTIESYIFVTRYISVRFLQGLFIILWLFTVAIDVIGFMLLFHFAGTDNWVIKVLTIIAALGIAHGFREMSSVVPSLNNEQATHLKAGLMQPVKVRTC